MDHIKEYVNRVLKVLIYIEDHIEEELILDELAKVACHSPFHFHRIFQAIVGETIHKYVRRLRLERAAGRLLYTNNLVTDIALDANYDTPSAFTRAFKQCMGKSPRNYRALYKEVNAMIKKINELPMIQPDKIEKTFDLNVLSIRRVGNDAAERSWKAMVAYIKENQLDESRMRYFSISHDDPQVTSEDKLRMEACIQTSQEVPVKWNGEWQVLKGGKYAIFSYQGPHKGLHEVCDRIFLRWLPDSKEKFDDLRPVFCELFNLDYMDVDESKLITKIYIPLS